MVTACSREMVELSLADREFELACRLEAIAVLGIHNDIRQIASIDNPMGKSENLTVMDFVNSLFSISNGGVLPKG